MNGSYTMRRLPSRARRNIRSSNPAARSSGTADRAANHNLAPQARIVLRTGHKRRSRRVCTSVSPVARREIANVSSGALGPRAGEIDRIAGATEAADAYLRAVLHVR